jgi:hypothetical protein
VHRRVVAPRTPSSRSVSRYSFVSLMRNNLILIVCVVEGCANALWRPGLPKQAM